MSTFTEEYYDDDFNTSLLDIVNQDRLLLDLDLFPTVDDMLLWFDTTIDDSMTSPIICIINHVDVPEDTIIIRPSNTIEPEEQQEETDDQDEEQHTPNLYYSG
jgi:hypothetical protein